MFHFIIIEQAFKKGIEVEDSLVILAKKCCPSLNEVKILVSHLPKKKENHAKAACGRQTRLEQGRNKNDFNRNKQFKFILKTTQI